jgi:hypothetical protein
MDNLTERLEVAQALCAFGIRPKMAETLARDFEPADIRKQLAWIQYRPIQEGGNRQGLLVACIRAKAERPLLAPDEVPQ